MHFGGRVLPCFAAMFQPNEFHHFHVAFGQANDASPSKSLVNTVLIFRHRRLKNRCAWQIAATWRRKRYARRDQRGVSYPWCRSFFRAVAFAAECEDLYEAGTPSHFSQACLAISSLLAFWGIERVRAQAGIFVFCAVGKAGYAVCFFRSMAHRRCLAGSRGFCVSGTLRSFRQGLENWRAGGGHLKTCSQPVRGQQA